jgi:hypothetical protein
MQLGILTLASIDFIVQLLTNEMPSRVSILVVMSADSAIT